MRYFIRIKNGFGFGLVIRKTNQFIFYEVLLQTSISNSKSIIGLANLILKNL